MTFSMMTSVKAFMAIAMMATTISYTQPARAEDEVFDLSIDSETAIADSVAEEEENELSRERLDKERQRHFEDVNRLKAEIAQARSSEASAKRERIQNEREIAQLQKSRMKLEMQFREIRKQEQKAQKILATTEGQKTRVQRSHEAITQKRDAAFGRMNERQEQAKSMVEQYKKAQEDFKAAQSQYKDALQREKMQKIALQKRKAQMKKKSAELKAKTEKLKAMTKKIDQNRRG